MTPQTVLIYGVPCLLQKTGGGALTSYAVTDPTGVLITQQPSRFMAVAQAAKALLPEKAHA